MSKTDTVEAAEPTVVGRRRPVFAYVVAVVGIFWLLFGLAGGSYQGKLSNVQKNDQAAYLPSSAESTKVDQASQLFQHVQTIPGFIVYQRDAGLTAADKFKIASDAKSFRRLSGVAADKVGNPQFSPDSRVASVEVPLIAKVGSAAIQGNRLSDVEKQVIAVAKTGAKCTQ